jgi:fatty acid desaturase
VLAQRGSDYAELSRVIKGLGLLERRPGFYIRRFVLNAGLFVAGWTVFGLVGSSWWQLFTAAFFAVVFAQLSFVGHDAGHKQIFRSKRANDAVGHIHGFLTGLSYGWWNGKHNRHHANPNQVDEDPDVDIPILAFGEDQARGKRGFLRWTAKHQASLFFPLLLLEGLNLHYSSIRSVWRRETRVAWLEGSMLTTHIVGYVAVVFWVLSPLQAVLFIAVHQGLWGIYMGCSFAPNHKGMLMPASGHDLDYLRKQVLTSRNVRGGGVVDFAFGGLNYQIEHHLFPSMPRPNLRHAQRHVREFCARRDIPYSQCGVVTSYVEVLRHLHEVSAPLRVPANS